MSDSEQTTEAQPETPTEAQAQPAAPVTPPPRVAEALQTLMDREKSVRDAEANLKNQTSELERARKLLDMAKANPLQFLDHVGTSYEDISQQVMQGNRPDPTAHVKKELADLRKQFEVRQQREESTRRQAALDEARNLVTSFVNESAEYPLTKAAGMQNMVFEKIHQHYNNTGEALSEASAAKEVEDYLLGVVDKLAQVESVRNRFGVSPEATNEPSVNQMAQTLTNLHSSSTPTRKNEGTLNHTESIRRAAAMLEFVNNT